MFNALHISRFIFIADKRSSAPAAVPNLICLLQWHHTFLRRTTLTACKLTLIFKMPSKQGSCWNVTYPRMQSTLMMTKEKWQKLVYIHSITLLGLLWPQLWWNACPLYILIWAWRTECSRSLKSLSAFHEDSTWFIHLTRCRWWPKIAS